MIAMSKELDLLTKIELQTGLKIGEDFGFQTSPAFQGFLVWSKNQRSVFIPYREEGDYIKEIIDFLKHDM
jgi:hypothetical protein